MSHISTAAEVASGKLDEVDRELTGLVSDDPAPVVVEPSVAVSVVAAPSVAVAVSVVAAPSVAVPVMVEPMVVKLGLSVGRRIEPVAAESVVPVSCAIVIVVLEPTTVESQAGKVKTCVGRAVEPVAVESVSIGAAAFSCRAFKAGDGTRTSGTGPAAASTTKSA